MRSALLIKRWIVNRASWCSTWYNCMNRTSSNTGRRGRDTQITFPVPVPSSVSSSGIPRSSQASKYQHFDIIVCFIVSFLFVRFYWSLQMVFCSSPFWFPSQTSLRMMRLSATSKRSQIAAAWLTLDEDRIQHHPTNTDLAQITFGIGVISAISEQLSIITFLMGEKSTGVARCRDPDFSCNRWGRVCAVPLKSWGRERWRPWCCWPRCPSKCFRWRPGSTWTACQRDRCPSRRKTGTRSGFGRREPAATAACCWNPRPRNTTRQSHFQFKSHGTCWRGFGQKQNFFVDTLILLYLINGVWGVFFRTGRIVTGQIITHLSFIGWRHHTAVPGYKAAAQ